MNRPARLAIALLLGTALLVVPRGWATGPFDKASCSFGGKKLYGKIKVVTAFPDVKVQKVSAFPDLKVQKVTAFPDRCGKWQFVEAFPDTTVQFVDAFPDVKITYVDAFPGVD